jgi:hypothetical protein
MFKAKETFSLVLAVMINDETIEHIMAVAKPAAIIRSG